MSKKKEVEEVKKGAVATTEVPEYLKNFMGQDRENADSLISSSMSVPRISYRGKRFRFIEDGEEELVKELTIRVIVLGVEPEAGLFIKTYYESAYQPGGSEPPTCTSSDGIRPDPWVIPPQAPICSQCAKNVFGSATSRTGGKAKACKEGKRLWVSKPERPDFYYGLLVPIMSLKALAEYGKYIAKNGYPLALVITEIGLEDDAEFPQLTFKHAGFVQEKYAKDIIAVNKARPWIVPVKHRALPEGNVYGQIASPAKTESAEAPKAETVQKDMKEVLGSW
jgi:hypothetical protein